MIKMAADTKTSPQQSEVGMLSITGWGATAGAIVTGAVGGVTGVAVKVKSGCVLDIFPGAGFGGSGRILMRAVSLANGVVGGVAGGAGAAAAVPMGRGTGVLAGSGGGGTAAGGGGGGANVRGYRHTGDRWFGQRNLRHRRSRNWDVTGFRHEWCRCRRRLRRRWPSGQVDPHGIVILRGDGISTTGWESNPDSFFFWLVGFGHGHIDGWKNKICQKLATLSLGNYGHSVKGSVSIEALPTFVSFVFFVHDHLLE